jgi:hypothetical protein
MKAQTKISGVDQLLDKVAMLSKPESAKSVAMAFTYAFLGVQAQACKDASPGSIKQECGKFVRVAGTRVWGRAGLMKFPRPGDGQNGPHGVYLTLGTKFIRPQGFIEGALRGSQSRAIEAGKAAAKRRVERLVATAK